MGSHGITWDPMGPMGPMRSHGIPYSYMGGPRRPRPAATHPRERERERERQRQRQRRQWKHGDPRTAHAHRD